jgi:hypothetical protein
VEQGQSIAALRFEKDRRFLMNWEDGSVEDGSITVFMTFVFLLLFALTGAALDSARFFASKGYVLASAYGGEVAIYGEYNRELYENYGIFAYGGYDGLDTEDWREEFLQILQENLRERPETTGNSLSGFGKYASVYQLKNLSVNLKKTGNITEKKYFFQQLDDWMETEALQDLTETILGQVQGTDSGKQGELLSDLEENTQVEQKKAEAKSGGGASYEAGGDEEAETVEEVTTVKNPVEYLKELLQNGVLSLVCDEEAVSEKVMEQREEGTEVSSENENWFSQDSGTNILKGLMGQQESLWNDEMTKNQTKKGKLILYASQMLTSYVSQGGSAVDYGLEYLVTGKTSSKDAFAGVVNRLFLIRTLLNYAYVEKDATFQAASLETATAIAAPLMAEAFIPVIQHCILMVLALEESCVDICALLQGRQVPLTKTKSTFRMKYAEICQAGKTLFQNKAKTYSMVEKSSSIKSLNKGLGYSHYLWIMMLMQPLDTLYERVLDVIQYDLRERVNGTFTLADCICYTKAEITYEMPMLYWGIQKISASSGQSSRGNIARSITVTYGY